MTQQEAVKRTVLAILDSIKDLKEVPSGHLYASVMHVLSLESYNQIIYILKASGKVRESGNLLTYVGE